ncbi:hypothetical protein B0J13DRAFT_573986 [Dactylonectria estremocensis]|uniref:Secreted protein n=1 Tax=Dactylonectria estremocensis TaxID=1079267 RepID=A0A9P9IAP8_9HYPO|nr:hypothetical protein B0J13DRAFT_573986 [Dactylonectria estremocensis]
MWTILVGFVTALLIVLPFSFEIVHFETQSSPMWPCMSSWEKVRLVILVTRCLSSSQPSAQWGAGHPCVAVSVGLDYWPQQGLSVCRAPRQGGWCSLSYSYLGSFMVGRICSPLGFPLPRIRSGLQLACFRRHPTSKRKLFHSNYPTAEAGLFEV